MVKTKDFINKAKLLFTDDELDKVLQAFELCQEMHHGQRRRSGENFSAHPIEVASILMEWQASSDMIAAALLHDSVEDSTLTVDKISKKFGPSVSLYVYGLTNDFIGDNLSQKSLEMLVDDPNIIIIKLADRLHNMRTLAHMPKHKQEAKARETLSLYIPLARHLNQHSVAAELIELSNKYL